MKSQVGVCLYSPLRFSPLFAALICASPLATAQTNTNKSVQLEAVVIKGEGPTPTATVDAYQLQVKDGGDPQRALRGIPGVFTNQASNQPGIEISIRGLSGYGRINTMIDGVPQTFKNIAGHTASGNALVYVHPELLSGITVVRGVVSGAQGSGTLAGAANLRTLNENDVLQHGNTGGLTRFKSGNNGAHSSGVAAVGHRFTDIGGNDGTLSLIAAVAYTSEGNYKTGNGNKLSKQYSSVSSPKGGLAKVRFQPNGEHQLDLGTVWYRNTFNNSNYEWDVHNKTFNADYAYTPNNPLLSLSGHAYINQTSLDYIGGTGSYVGRRIDNNTWGINLSNASNLSLQNTHDLHLSYGVAWDHTYYEPKRMRGGNHPGKIDKGSIFSNAEWEVGAATILAGLRYDHYRLNGYRPPYSAGVADCPVGGARCGDRWESHSSGKLLPNLGLQYNLNEQWSVYGMYAHTFRPPSTHEAFYGMVPFGDGKGSGHANNLGLKPEYSNSIDLAIAFQDEGLLRDDDRAHFRLGYFNNRIKNYIFNDSTPVKGVNYPVAMWVNATNKVRLHGVELTGGYDASFAYANLSYSHSKLTTQPIGFGTGMNGGSASLAPATVWTLDVGTRFWNERATVGAQVRHLGSSKAVKDQWFGDGYWDSLPGYSLIDLYASVKLNTYISLFANVENLSNRQYGYAGSMNYDAQSGRGRTITAGLEARF